MESLSLNSPKMRATADKFPGLDAVRGMAALGVVLFHACIPYLKHPVPGLNWAVVDHSSHVVDCVYWWIELFIMPLFLVMAGFLAMKTLHRRGRMSLVKSRARRLLKPLLFGMVVILPLDLYCWVLGWVADGVVAPVKLKSLKFEGTLAENLWGLSHLWFLQYLFLYVVALAAVAYLWDRMGDGADVGRATPAPRSERDLSASTGASILRLNMGAKIAIIIGLGTATLCWAPEVVWGFQHRFEPVPSKWIYSGLSFAVGCILAVDDGQLTRLSTGFRRLAVPAGVCSVSAVILGRWHLAGGQNAVALFTLAALSSASSVLITLSILGWAVRHIDRVGVPLAYLSAASFWIYIVHHPMLGLVHIDLKLLLPNVSPVIKTMGAFAITSGLCLATYEVFVRRTPLGRWLGFAWEFPTTAEARDGAETIRLPNYGAGERQRAA